MDNYQLAFDIALNTDRNLFVTGKAGTGKTTFLHQLKETSHKQIAVVAPTGVAAINAGGTTIHSFFQLPLSPFLPTPEGRKELVSRIKMRSHRRRVLQELEMLVIDEISMVRADLLDAIDAVLRHFRRKNDLPFGGVQMVFIGDMFQLSPVIKDDEWRMLSQYYQSPYFFHSHGLLHNPPLYVEFDKIYRQTNGDFITILNQIRDDCVTDESFNRLSKRYDPLFKPTQNDGYVILTTHNYQADRINTEELEKLEGETFTFNARIEGDYPDRMYPTDPTLELKIGARVMFLRNDTETPRRFYNGKTGVVESVEQDRIVVLCGEDDRIDLERIAWENISYSVNDETKQVEERVLGKFSQYPLRLAWAITIHKSQGLTFDKVVIDAGLAFAPGQVYVALSRCRSLEGIVLLSKLYPENIYTDSRIVAYEKSRVPASILEKELPNARKIYRMRLLETVFDFEAPLAYIDQLIVDVRKKETSFNDETIPYLQEIRHALSEINTVGLKFRTQLRAIFRNEPFDEDYLRERLQAADSYFTAQTQPLMDRLKQSPATTDSRAHAAEYNEGIGDIFSDLALKRHLLHTLKSDPSIASFFEAKNSFVVPSLGVNAYAKTMAERPELSNPALYRLLTEERNRICDEQNLPIYFVAGSKTLYEMAEYLPLDSDELLQITGFGPAKVEKYGMLFLSIIRSYCEKYDLSSALPVKESSRKKRSQKGEKKTKRQKGDSMRVSLDMFRAGKSVEEIAEERGIAPSTVGTHLAKYVEKGELRVEDFVPRERLRLAEEKLKKNSPDESIYYTLHPEFSNTEIMMIVAHLRNGASQFPEE